MAKNKFLGCFVLLFLALIFMKTAFANVEVFSDYSTELDVHTNNTIDVKKHLTLKNVYDVGIVPGQIEFKLAKGTQGSITNIDVTNVRAVDRFGKEIKTDIRKTSDHTLVILDVYYPLLPGFEYSFDLNYTLGYESSGIFFKSLEIPLRESTIPIENGDFVINLPEYYHFTYLDSNNDTATIEGNSAYWEIRNDMPNSIAFEYSYLPIKIGSMRGSYVFWIFINVILLAILVYEVRREIRKARKKGHNERK
jgi:hypothetical protein